MLLRRSRAVLGVVIAAGSFTLVSAAPLVAACGCSGMAVVWDQGTVEVCSNNLAIVEECQRAAGGPETPCPDTAYTYTCPTGVNDAQWGADEPYQRTGFRVTATYTEGSDGSECTPGQILQETITSGGAIVANPPINPTSISGDQTIGGLDLRIENDGYQTFPRVGETVDDRAFFGGDNYVAGAINVISSQTNAGSQWWDNTDQTKDNQPEVATWSYRFLAFVRGTDGQPSCSCAFDLAVDWDASSDPKTRWARGAAGSERCG